jgi:DnaJ-domain-containing protein 1
MKTAIDNYFVILGIEKQKFEISKKLITKKYLELYRSLTPELSQKHMYDAITLNKAYITLVDPISRAEHIFHLARFDTEAHAVSPRIFDFLDSPKSTAKILYSEMKLAFRECDLHKAYEYWCMYKYILTLNS